MSAVCLALGACTIFNQPRFGKLPQGDSLDHIQGSPNYKDVEFQYPIPTPVFSKDVGTVTALRSKVKRVVCPLGVSAYFEYWDYPKDKIREGDWYDRIPLG